MVKCIDLSRVPVVREGFYATNNQFQKSGPKGFIEIKILPNDNLYVRVDLPGVPDNAVRHRVDAVRQKIVFFSGESFNDGYEKEGVREYSGSAGLACDCCEITNVDAKMKDGVLRMILTRVKVKDHENKCTLTVPPFTGESGRVVEDHPYVMKGRKGAFFGGAAPRPEGAMFFAVDMPGVSISDLELRANEVEMKFRAQVKDVGEHDESGRFYAGCLEVDTSYNMVDKPSLLTYKMTATVNFGILKILLTPPPKTNISG